MITFLIASFLKAMFLAGFDTVKAIFGGFNGSGTLWNTTSAKIAAVLQINGVGVGIGLVNTFIGIDFLVWATALALAIVITMRFWRLMLGLFSKST